VTGLGRQKRYKIRSGNQRTDFVTLVQILGFVGYERSLKKKIIAKKPARLWRTRADRSYLRISKILSLGKNILEGCIPDLTPGS
jgi:hypothetical protein